MVDESDYEDILDDNVSNVKKKIRDMDDPDYSKLLDMEKNGKDRKTVKEFLDNKANSQEVEIQEHEMEDEETVEGIEEQTDSGLLGAYSRSSLVVGGVFFGLLIGLIAGMAVADLEMDGDAQEAEDTIAELLEASGVEDFTFQDTEERHGMFYVAVEVPAQQQPGEEEVEDETVTEAFYVTRDTELVFPEVQSPMIQSPIVVADTLEQLRQQPAEGQFDEEDLQDELEEQLEEGDLEE